MVQFQDSEEHDSEPTWEDFNVCYPFDLYAEGIGMTGWKWATGRSLWCGYDFDHISSHAKGIGLSDEDLQRVKDAACALPYVEVRRSTGGAGVHLYVYFDDEGIPTENHTEHAAVARCVLGMMMLTRASTSPVRLTPAVTSCGYGIGR